MLLAKDFKTAVAVVIAVAGLLGFGTANATVLLSEGDAIAASKPLVFAAELYPGILPASPSTEGGTPTATTTVGVAGVEVGNLNAEATGGGIDIALLRDDRYFIRFDLVDGGEKNVEGLEFGNFNSDPVIRRGPDSAPLYTSTQRVRGGRDGNDHGIWNFSVCPSSEANCTSGSYTADSGTANSADTVVDVLVSASEWTVEIGSGGLRDRAIRVPRNLSATGNTCYTMLFRLYDTQAAARSGTDGWIVKAKAPYMCFVKTLDAKVTAPQTLTASVAEGFRRFVGDSPASGRLATASVTVAKTWMGNEIQDPEDGMGFADGDVLEGVEFSLTGTFTHSSPFGFGEFKLGSTTMTRLDAAGEEITAAANKTAAGKAGTAKVMAEMDETGSVAISVDVSGNNASSATNVYEAIGAGSYKAAIEIDQVNPGTGQGAEQNPDAKSDIAAGTIDRDGTTVRIGYLQTITELERDGDIIGWNQRLVITNHGSIEADVMLSDFNAEDGAEVACKMPTGNNVVDGEGKWECGENGEVETTIGANSQLVLKVADLIAGAPRTSGMITIAQDSSQISVASTHVTLPGGQTDTVLYWPLQ